MLVIGIGWIVIMEGIVPLMKHQEEIIVNVRKDGAALDALVN
jgi:hypothetical protein